MIDRVARSGSFHGIAFGSVELHSPCGAPLLESCRGCVVVWSGHLING